MFEVDETNPRSPTFSLTHEMMRSYYSRSNMSVKYSLSEDVRKVGR